MEPEVSLPHSQEPVTYEYSYPEQNQPSPCLSHPTFPFLNSCQRIIPIPRHLSCSQHVKFFLWRGAVSTSLNSQPEDAPCRGDRDPFVVAGTSFRKKTNMLSKRPKLLPLHKCVIMLTRYLLAHRKHTASKLWSGLVWYISVCAKGTEYVIDCNAHTDDVCGRF